MQLHLSEPVAVIRYCPSGARSEAHLGKLANRSRGRKNTRRCRPRCCLLKEVLLVVIERKRIFGRWRTPLRPADPRQEATEATEATKTKRWLARSYLGTTSSLVSVVTRGPVA